VLDLDLRLEGAVLEVGEEDEKGEKGEKED
jgi:hypothetical protein